MSCKYQTGVSGLYIVYDLPHLLTGIRIHAGTGLIQEYNGWVANAGDGNA